MTPIITPNFLCSLFVCFWKKRNTSDNEYSQFFSLISPLLLPSLLHSFLLYQKDYVLRTWSVWKNGRVSVGRYRRHPCRVQKGICAHYNSCLFFPVKDVIDSRVHFLLNFLVLVRTVGRIGFKYKLLQWGG